MSKEKNCNLNRIYILILPQTVYWLGSLCLLTMSGWMVCPPARNLVSPCLPLSPHMCACVDGASAFPRSCLPLSPTVSHMCPCVGWWVSLQRVLSPLASNCLGWCVRLPEVLPPLVSHCLHTRVPVLDGASAFPRSCLCLSPIVSHCLPTCVPVLAGASAFPTSCLPLRWLMRPPSRGLVCPCLLVFPHVCLRWMLCPPSRGLVSPCRALFWLGTCDQGPKHPSASCRDLNMDRTRIVLDVVGHFSA